MSPTLRPSLSLLLVGLLTLAGCGSDSAPQPTGIPDVLEAKGGTPGPPNKDEDEDGDGDGDPLVDEVDPPSAPQDTTLDVTVKGSGFDEGSDVEWALDGEGTTEIVTLATAFVNSKRLVATIAIAPDAPLDFYDAVVITSRGRKGIGTEVFEVTVKQTGPIAVTVGSFGGDLTSADGSSLTTDRDRGSEVEISIDGRLFVKTDAKRPRKGLSQRQMCATFTEVVSIASQQDADDFVAAGGSLTGPVCSTVTLHTRDHSNPGKMGGQLPGTTARSGGKVVLLDFAMSASWEWRLLFDSRRQEGTSGETDGRGVCIRRHDLDRWTVWNGCEAAGDVIDDVVELWRFTGDDIPVLVAELRMPFGFEVVRD